MRPSAVIEVDVLPDARLCCRSALVRVQKNFLVLKRFPEAFDHDIVAPATFAIHAQCDAVLLASEPNEVAGCELYALIGIKDGRRAVLLDRVNMSGVRILPDNPLRATKVAVHESAPRSPFSTSETSFHPLAA